jgi:hypothetical protein
MRFKAQFKMCWNSDLNTIRIGKDYYAWNFAEYIFLDISYSENNDGY